MQHCPTQQNDPGKVKKEKFGEDRLTKSKLLPSCLSTCSTPNAETSLRLAQPTPIAFRGVVKDNLGMRLVGHNRIYKIVQNSYSSVCNDVDFESI